MYISKYKDTRCPYCANYIDSVAHQEQYTPEVGDISMCFYCGELSEFGETNLVALDETERQERQQHLDEQMLYFQMMCRKRYTQRMKTLN